MDDKVIYRAVGGVAGFGITIIVLSAFFVGTPKANVAGRVTYQGRAVIWGSVVIAGKDGRTAAGAINPDGTFSVANAPTDAVTVGVISRDPLVQTWATNLKETRDRPNKKIFSASPVDRKKWFPIPERYEQPSSSGITLILKRGDNECNVELQ
ncbi:MAG: hypothetical protein U0746_00480 [Gemmataceae bacterium]